MIIKLNFSTKALTFKYYFLHIQTQSRFCISLFVFLELYNAIIVKVNFASLCLESLFALDLIRRCFRLIVYSSHWQKILGCMDFVTQTSQLDFSPVKRKPENKHVS